MNLHASHLNGKLWTDAALDGLKDGLWSIPVLFVAYLLMELLERSNRLNESTLRRYSRRAGPALGGLLGVMLAVFFATSDEMLPILLSSLTEQNGVSVRTLLLIVAGKALLGVALGYLADLLLHPLLRADKDIHSFCEREHCACDEEEGNVFVSALKHTVKIALMLVAVNIALNLLFSFIGVERLSGTFLRHPLLGSATLALFGLIPNCSVSVVLTQTYLSGVIGVGGLFAGLLSNAGIGLLVLYRTNRNTRENLWITGFLFAASAASGIVITLLSGLF